MLNTQAKTGEKRESGADGGQVRPPAISLPKGGGAIRGMGEKFAANPVTGTGSMTVPIATSPGRFGFGPELSLSYDSGAGNGPFGLGWSLNLPQITRKTDKGLPQYQDAEESDVFILSGAEDLVPVLVQVGGNWEREAIPPRTADGKTYRIQRYRPRIEGLFARIERWTNVADASDSFWRSISRDNITTWYGKTGESRIADPADPARIFSWLICESRDDKGNAIVYEFQGENADGVDVSQVHEKNRSDSSRSANRYLKRIKYGNRVSHLIQPDVSRADYNTISDVILHIQYTAREGGRLLRQKAVEHLRDRVQEAETSGLVLLFSLRHDFPSEWHRFVSGEEDFRATVKKSYFPYFVQGEKIEIQSVVLYGIQEHELLSSLPSDVDEENLTTLLRDDKEFVIALAADDVLKRKPDAQVFLLVRYAIG